MTQPEYAQDIELETYAIKYETVELEGSDISTCNRCGMVFLPAPMNNYWACTADGADPIYCPLCKSLVTRICVIKEKEEKEKA